MDNMSRGGTAEVRSSNTDFRSADNTPINPLLTSKAEDIERGLQGDLISCCTDWLRLTFKGKDVENYHVDVQTGEIIYEDLTPWRVLDILQIETEDSEGNPLWVSTYVKGMTNYDMVLGSADPRYDGIYIAYDNDGAMGHQGIHVSAGGRGCRSLGKIWDNDWKALAQRTFEFDVKPSQVDLALDYHSEKDFTVHKHLHIKYHNNCADLFEKIKRGEYVSQIGYTDSRATEYDPEKPYKKCGYTHYFGSGDLKLKIYQKGLEQLFGPGFPWTRFEFTYRNKKAMAIWSAIAQGSSISTLIRDQLKTSIEFKQPGKASQKTRWKTAAYWERFLEGTEKMKLSSFYTPLEKPKLESVFNWMDKSVKKTFNIGVGVGGLDFIKYMLLNVDITNEDELVYGIDATAVKQNIKSVLLHLGVNEEEKEWLLHKGVNKFIPLGEEEIEDVEFE